MKKLGLYLLSYKRPDLFKEALDSLLQQDYDDFEIIVSENSPDESVTPVLNSYLPHTKIKVIRRSPHFQSLDHFNQIIIESSAYEFAMFFHDDDIMLPHTLKALVDHLEASPTVTAVAGNAVFLRDKMVSTDLLMTRLKTKTIVPSQNMLMFHYFALRGSHAAFPCYIYRTKFLKGLGLIKKDGGKYADVSFLLKLIERGPFIWLPEPTIQYRIHATNDSAHLNLKEIFKLSWFSFKTRPLMLPLIVFYFAKQFLKKIKMQFE